MRLPPPGSSPAETATFVDFLFREAANDQRRLDWQEEAEDGINWYAGNQEDNNDVNDGRLSLTVNRIQPCITAMVAIQAADPPKVIFTPRETGEEPLIYINTKTPMGKQIAGMFAGAFDPTQPVPTEFVPQVQQIIDQGEMQAMQFMSTGMPVPQEIPRKTDVVEVTDATAAEARQTVFDAMWEDSNAQPAFIENIMLKNVLGTQSLLYEFDDENKRHVLTNVHTKQTFFDPTKFNPEASQYALWDEPATYEQAVAKYPQHKAMIDQFARQGKLVRVGSAGYEVAHQLAESYWYRDVLFIRHCWIRNQPYKLSPEEAIAKGLCVPGQKPVPMPVAPQPEQEAEPLGTQDLQNEQPAPPAPEPQMMMQDCLLHPETGEEMTQDHPDWPMRNGIRYIVIIGPEAVEDREWPLSDIPLIYNVNIPFPYSPWGHGEPKRLQGLQEALNNVLSDIITQHEFNAFPPEYVAQEVADAMDKALRKNRTAPNKRVVVPTSIMARVGNDISKCIQVGDTPPVPADSWKLVQWIMDAIDKEGNMAEVLEGNAASTWSGEAINSLQNAANQLIKGKSLFTEAFIKRLALLMCNAIDTRMTPEDCAKYDSKHPIQVWQAFHSKWKRMNIDVKVQITSGSGANQTAQTNNLVQAKRMGVPISYPTIMERMDLDPDVEAAKDAAFAKKAMLMQGQMPGQQQTQAQPQETQNGNENGNGISQ